MREAIVQALLVLRPGGFLRGVVLRAANGNKSIAGGNRTFEKWLCRQRPLKPHSCGASWRNKKLPAGGTQLMGLPGKR